MLLLAAVIVVAPGASPPGGPGNPGGIPTPEPLQWPSGASILPSEGAGFLPATSGVSPTGEYTLSLPLDVPPGRAGMAPTVALHYGSHGGNGIAGVGWTLSATSVIQRCAATLATEGFTDGVDFDSDRYCLDGEKLIAISGSYGAGGAEYRTERDPFSKIVGFGDSGAGLSSFEVRRPDGAISTYAVVLAARPSPSELVSNGGVMDPLTPFAYLLAETSDRHGNTVHYHYTVESESAPPFGLSVRLSRIAYTGKGLEEGNREVVFHYEPRPDPTFAYVAGVRTRQDKRLAAVEMRAPSPLQSETVWTYALDYRQSKGSERSLLERVRKRDAAGVSLWAKEFDWAEHSRPAFATMSFPGELDAVGATEGFPSAGLQPFDADGDGKDDLVYYVQQPGYGHVAGFFRKTSGPAGPGLPEPLLDERHPVDNEIGWGRPVDRQNDGRIELLAKLSHHPVYDYPYTQLFHWDGAQEAFVPEPGLGAPAASWPAVADLDGNGWADTLFVGDYYLGEDSSWFLARGGADGFVSLVDTGILTRRTGPPRAGDIDGDGRGDVLVNDPDFISKDDLLDPNFVPSHTMVLRLDDNGAVVADKAWDLGDQRAVALADVNGDGLKDAVDLSGTFTASTPVRYNLGTGFGPAVQVPFPIAKAADDRPAVRVADFDRDGADDLLVLRDGLYLPKMAVYLSRPSGFKEVAIAFEPQATPVGHSWEPVKVGDFNGDGLSDIAQLRQTEDQDGIWNAHLEILRQMPGESDVLTGYRDEHAPQPRETVTYGCTVAPVPGGATCAYPQKCLARGMLLVDQIDTYRQDMTGPQRRMRYRFAGARADLHGRGFLGFEQVSADDLDSHARTLTSYDNQTRDGTLYPFAGLPLTTTTIVPILTEPLTAEPAVLTSDGAAVTARVHRVTTTYVTHRLYGDRAYFVHPSQSVESEWEQAADIAGPHVELLGAEPPAAREVLRSFTFDAFGNATYESRQTTSGTFSYAIRGFDNREDDWLLGLETLRITAEGEPAAMPPPRFLAMEYDGSGKLRRTTREPYQPDYQATTELFRDDRGLVTQITRTAPGLDPRHTYFTFDDDGAFVRAVRNDKGHVARLLHHAAFGVPVLSEDANGVQQRSYYDGFGRLRAIEPEGTVATEIHYEARGEQDAITGLRVSATSADGAAAYRGVDEHGLVRESGVLGFDGTWAVAETDYNPFGRPFFQSRPGAGAPAFAATLTQYDTLGRVLAVSPPDGTVTTFVHGLFESTSTDARGRSRTTSRDKDGRVRHSRELADDGHAIATHYGYGPFSQVESIADSAGHLTQIEYDKIGRRTRLVDPDRGTLHFAYDGHDQLTREWDDALLHDVGYRYDALGRLSRKTDTHGNPDGGPAVTEISRFAYDHGPGARGRLSSAVSPDGVTTAFAYDALGRPATTTWTIDDESFAVEQSYDPAGRPDVLRYPEVPGRARFLVKHVYNAFGYLSTVAKDTAVPATPYWTVKARTLDGLLEQAEWASGAVEKRGYHTHTGRLENVRVDAGKTLFNVAYAYDEGELSQRTDAVAGRTETFHYDALDRLQKWSLAALAGPSEQRSVEYGYDDLGNLTSATTRLDGQAQPAETFGYDTQDKPHAVRSRSLGGQPAAHYHYDERGRMFEGGGRGIGWTSFDLPRWIAQGGQTTTFRYDAFGGRVKKTREVIGGPAATTVTIAGIYERRTQAGQTEHRFYVGGDGGPVAEVVYREASAQTPATEELHHIARDGLGSVALLFEPDGDVIERLFYEPFGGRIDAAGAKIAAPVSGLQLGFTGHSHDDDLVLIDMKGRIYDPVIRRFLSPDPVVHNPLASQSLNRFSYVWNNPLRYVDPSGWDGEAAGNAAPEPAGESGIVDQVVGFFSDFLGLDTTIAFRVKPTGQLLPEAAPVELQAEDAPADEAASAPRATASSARGPRAVTHGPDLGPLQVVPIVTVMTTCYGQASSNLEHAQKAFDAAVAGDGYHAADEALQIPEEAGRAAGAVFIDAARSMLTLGGNVDRAVHGDSPQERIEGAMAAGGDAVNIAAAAVLVGGAGASATPSGAVGSSKVLAGALEAGGQARPAGGAAHHIVAGRARSANDARAVLQKFGIGINDAANGVFLPGNKGAPNAAGVAVHSSLHTPRYYDAVNEALQRATSRQHAVDILNDIAKALQSGGYP